MVAITGEINEKIMLEAHSRGDPFGLIYFSVNPNMMIPVDATINTRNTAKSRFFCLAPK